MPSETLITDDIVPTYVDRDGSVGIATGYFLEVLRASFSTPAQTGPGDRPASYTMDTDTLSLGKVVS